MVYKLLIALCLFAGLNVTAQEHNTSLPYSEPITITIDYKQVGTPMPDLVIASYHDSTKTNDGPLSKKQKKQLAKDPMANQQIRLITADELKNNGSLLVMIFNPTCTHCEATTDMLEKNISLFEKSKIVLLATSRYTEYIPLFIKKHNTDHYKNIYVGTDTSGFINNTFLYQPMPQINIYNAERKLVKIYTGDVPIDSLKQYIQ